MPLLKGLPLMRATGRWGAAARRQDLQLSHTLVDADSTIKSVAWAPDGRLAAGSSDGKVRVYDQAGSVGLGGWFLSYCATSLVLSSLLRCEPSCCCWSLAVSNPFQYQTAMIAQADPGFKGSGLRTDANAAQRLQFCVVAAKFLKVRCADEQALHGALLGSSRNF